MKWISLLVFAVTLDAQKVEIRGDVLKPGSIDLTTLAVEKITVKDVSYEGVLLSKVLEAAGQEMGTKIKGTQLAKSLLVASADEYRVALSLAEVDPTFQKRRVLLVFRRDGTALDDKEGPVRLIVEGDLRQTRWSKRVVSIEAIAH